MDIRVVFFDYGGTLDGEASHWLDRFVALYREDGLDLPFERVKDAFYHADEAAYGNPDAARMSLASLMDFHVGVQLDRLRLGNARLHRRLVERFVSRSEAALAVSRERLGELAGRFRLGVISNFYGNVGRVLADARIAPLLAAVVDSSLVGLWKPDRRIFAHALDAVGAEPGEALHVGDSYERDVCAARAAGLRTAWLAAGNESPQRAAPPEADLVIHSLAELPAWLAAGGIGRAERCAER